MEAAVDDQLMYDDFSVRARKWKTLEQEDHQW